MTRTQSARSPGSRAEGARGSGEKAARTRRRILDATASLLATRGYAGTRLSDVARLAGVRPPAIYYYVDSREDPVEQVVVAGMVRNLEHVRARVQELPATASAMDRICCAVEAHLQAVLRISDYTVAAVRTTAQLPPQVRDRQLAEQQRYVNFWRELVEAARVSGELRPELDPRAARMLVLGALNWACEWWSPGRGSLRSLVRTAQTIVRRGLTAPTGG
ncbi:Transcriptional regulator, TetR family [Pseudonocardia sp. Ae406_Ps2]|uniref:TetR/AcrR family transcriptional regulator n=1 Tax=unclassified Pseudonocardia TaxID=2619320 RepID=UPI00094AEC54|nr:MULTISPECIES: TetR/AcrR family transcriptional regulator [unclassified Pseudonocardia]OLL96883.1 Transcriptional regulator, TetR family [Pseudonocardia sp. Ae331_Ps2]OLM05406.1 Transcriptional regulator, TetR family [Pseudonocardia sp. Ae406_Ps2]OLM15646.1 Transcriptional regulator, TetR family [Pseudonocardia sp. Ae505_Ps2]OLM26976.1 Transcriptional regulator, TetR family [Pseudonocardia sp. Ae706_Ps2]